MKDASPYLNVTVFYNATDDYTLSPNASSHKNEYPKDLLNAAISCLFLFAIVGVSGNLISILALAKCPRLRNATTAFIINLCVADLIFCSFSTPFHAVMYMEPDWNYADSALCKLFPFVTYGNAFVSIFTVVAITINRYICIVHSRIYVAIYRPHYVAVMIFWLWMSVFLLLSLSLFEVWGKLGYRPETRTCDILLLNGKSPKKLLFFIALGLPSVVFVACYSRIYWVVRKSSRKVQSTDAPDAISSTSTTSTPSTTSTTQILPVTSNTHLGAELNTAHQVLEAAKMRKERKDFKVLKITMVIFFTYVLCYFPVSLMKLLRKEGDLLSLNVVVFLLAYLANCTNPIIYVVMSDEYRRAYIDLFTCWKTSSSH